MAQFWAAAIGNVGAISADTADNCRACETADLANAYAVHYYRVFTTHFSANAAYIILTAYISRVKAVGYCGIVCAAYTANLAFTLRGRRLLYFTVKGAAIDRAFILCADTADILLAGNFAAYSEVHYQTLVCTEQAD